MNDDFERFVKKKLEEVSMPSAFSLAEIEKAAREHSRSERRFRSAGKWLGGLLAASVAVAFVLLKSAQTEVPKPRIDVAASDVGAMVRQAGSDGGKSGTHAGDDAVALVIIDLLSADASGDMYAEQQPLSSIDRMLAWQDAPYYEIAGEFPLTLISLL